MSILLSACLFWLSHTTCPLLTAKSSGRLTPGWPSPSPGHRCWFCYPGRRCWCHCHRSWTGGCWRSWTGGSARMRTGWSRGCSWGTASETSAWRPGWCSSQSQRLASDDWGEYKSSPRSEECRNDPGRPSTNCQPRSQKAASPREPQQLAVLCLTRVF